MRELLERDRRAHDLDKGGASMVEVVSFNPEKMTVTVKPVLNSIAAGVNGERKSLAPLEIQEIPVGYGNGGNAAFFSPPKAGARGVLINTDREVSERGDPATERPRDKASGVFMPTGQDQSFRPNGDWTELRSGGARLAINGDTAVVSAGGTSIVLQDGKFDIIAGGISLIEALQQLSDHLGAVENSGHGGRKDRLVDDLIAAAGVSFSEGGV